MEPEDREIYSPESSDGRTDWPTRIGIAVLVLSAVALLIGAFL